MCNWPDETFEDMDTPLAVQQVIYLNLSLLFMWGTFIRLIVTVFFFYQYIQQMIRHDNTKIEEILEPPEGQDEGVWKYEHLRYYAKKPSTYLIFRKFKPSKSKI